MAATDARPPEILLVEDSPSDAALTREALKTCASAANCTRAADGVEAMEYLRRQGKYAKAARPDVILLDLNMPRKDGREVLKELKNDPLLMTIPVIVLTTSRAEQDVAQSYSLNANCYIIKPMDFGDFAAAVKSIEHFWLTVATLPGKI